MQLALRIISNHAARMGPNASKVFGEEGGIIGRAPSSDWVLPDQDNVVSGRHSIIRCMGGAFSLEDVSTNGTFLNDDPVAVRTKSGTVILKNGDKISIGDYEVYVTVVESMQQKELPALHSNPAANSFAHNPGADIPPSPPPQSLIHMNEISPVTQGIGPLDPLAALGGAVAQPKAAPATFPDHSPANLHNFRMPGLESAATPPAQTIPGHTIPSYTIPDDFTLTGSSFNKQPSLPQEPPPPPQPPVLLPPSQPIAPEVPGATRGTEQVYSALMPVIVQGMMDVLRSRADIKNQFRVDSTLMKPVDNNPLKFSPTADTAMTYLFNEPKAGYLSADEAFKQGFNDIKAHELAMMAGVRAAFAHMLDRFSPAVLEELFEGSDKRSNLLGMGGKRRYWDMYRTFFERTTRDSDDNFRDLFGTEFAKAYEEQMQQLTRGSKR